MVNIWRYIFPWLQSKDINWHLVNTIAVYSGIIVTLLTVHFQMRSNSEDVRRQIDSSNVSVARQIRAAGEIEDQRRRHETRRVAYEELTRMVVRLSDEDFDSKDYEEEFKKFDRHIRGVMKLYDDSSVYILASEIRGLIRIDWEYKTGVFSDSIKRVVAKLIDTCRTKLLANESR